jgi:hypothetical protein
MQQSLDWRWVASGFHADDDERNAYRFDRQRVLDQFDPRDNNYFGNLPQLDPRGDDCFRDLPRSCH